MTPIADFNYITPVITSKKSKTKVKTSKNKTMVAKSRYGNDSKKSKKKPIDMRSSP